MIQLNKLFHCLSTGKTCYQVAMLKREEYTKQISDALATVQTSISFRSSMSLFDINIFAEDFVKDLLNIVFDYNLKNLNSDIKNQASIDLGDIDNGVAYQVHQQKPDPKYKQR